MKNLKWSFVPIQPTSSSRLNKFDVLWASSRILMQGYASNLCMRAREPTSTIFVYPFSIPSLLFRYSVLCSRVIVFSFPHRMILIDMFKRLGGSRCHVSSTGDRSREFFEDDHGRAAHHWQRRGSHGIRRSCVQYVSGTLFVTLTYARDKR
jgi:hypothetical protein